MDNITTLITGGSRGIGLAIARAIAPISSKLLITAKHSEKLDRAKDLLGKSHSTKIVSLAVDHSQSVSAATRTGQWARRNTSDIDLLVLNAGYYVEGALSEIKSTDFEENLRVNFTVNHYLVHELLPLVKESRLRRIVIVGSTAAYEPYPLVPTYGVAKWALRGYAANLRRELMADNVGVTFISPGGTLTDMWEGEHIAANRLLDPADVAKLVVALTTLSPQAVVEELICRPMLGDIHE